MRSRGFTLIELMVTVVVLTILVTIAVPSFADYFQKAKVRGAADQITDLLARARAAAVKTNMPIAVAAKNKTVGWCVGAKEPAEPAAWAQRPNAASSCDCNSGSAACLVDGQKMIVDSGDLGTSRIPALAITGFDFSYSPKLGGVSSNGVGRSFLQVSSSSLLITSPNNRYSVQVVVTPLGQSYVCVPAGKPPFFSYRQC